MAWPSGFIHGSDPTGLIPRLSITIPFDPIGDKVKTKRVIRRLRLLAQGNLEKVLKDKKAYHDGIVHKATKTEVEIYPFFKNLYINEKGLDEISKILI